MRQLKIPKIWRRALIVAIPKPEKAWGSDGVSRRVSRPVFWSLGLEGLRSGLGLGLEGFQSRYRALRLETLHRLCFLKFCKKEFLKKWF